VKSAFAKATENKNGFLGAAKAPALEMTPTDVFFSNLSGLLLHREDPGLLLLPGTG